MKKSNNKLPVFCLDMYPHSRQNEPFYMIRLEELSRKVTDVEKPHSHSFYMLMIILNGSGQHVIDLKTYNISRGQIYFLSPGQVHNWDLSDDIEGYSLFFEAQLLTSQYPERLYSYPFFNLNAQSSVVDLAENINLFSYLFQQAFVEYQSLQSHRKEVILSFFTILLEKADRLYQLQFPIIRSSYDHILVQRYEQEINRHYLNHKDVKYYANLLSITPNHLNFLCKSVLDKTASQLIYERVGAEAQRLLSHTTASIKEIATDLNFEDSSYFNRFFKKQFGISPSEFKQVLW